jgi:SAM-dependent methyltransferase
LVEFGTERTEGERYQKDVQTLDADHPWHRIRELIPTGAIVLDVGCGSGDLGRFLADRAASVDGIEPNDERAESARKHLRTVVTGLGGPAAHPELAGPYDVVIFADVLEHMGYPDETLIWAASLLSPNGKIVALIPNSANWKFRRQIVKGDWSYSETGYFDRDHLRFFDTRTARELGTRVGLVELDVQFTPGRLPKPLSRSPKAAAFAAARRPNLFAGHVLVSWRPEP